MPVADKSAYDGSRVETTSQIILPDIMSGKHGKQKAVEKDVGAEAEGVEESHLVQQENSACEDGFEGIEDGKAGSSPTYDMR